MGDTNEQGPKLVASEQLLGIRHEVVRLIFDEKILPIGYDSTPEDRGGEGALPHSPEHPPMPDDIVKHLGETASQAKPWEIDKVAA